MPETACIIMAFIFFLVSSTSHLFLVNEGWRKEKKYYDPIDLWPNIVHGIIIGAIVGTSVYISAHAVNTIAGAVIGILVGSAFTVGLGWMVYSGLK